MNELPMSAKKTRAFDRRNVGNLVGKWFDWAKEVKMKHVDRHWKAYPAGNKGESPESECGVAKC